MTDITETTKLASKFSKDLKDLIRTYIPGGLINLAKTDKEAAQYVWQLISAVQSALISKYANITVTTMSMRTNTDEAEALTKLCMPLATGQLSYAIALWAQDVEKTLGQFNQKETH